MNPRASLRVSSVPEENDEDDEGEDDDEQEGDDDGHHACACLLKLPNCETFSFPPFERLSLYPPDKLCSFSAPSFIVSDWSSFS